MVKKGRHRRYEEARAVKHTTSELRLGDVGFVEVEPCPECGAEPYADHASWCLHDDPEVDDDIDGTQR
ncbi:MAG: hypothetical protein KY447_05890 [Actinobacteria bacterium]|nr:hypothetical protein [Actinomycetota bacterium]MBW3642429.1 hypothetical protein [Actinomycetota bacterium]